MEQMKDSLDMLIQGMRAKGIPVDADFAEELSRNVVSYTNLLRQQRGFGRHFYAVPRTTVSWDALAKEHHTRWSDLFFDLTVVASAFRLGAFLEHVVLYSSDIAETCVGLFVFASLFSVMFTIWEDKLDFAARFGSDDTMHKVFETMEACLHAVCAASIPVTPQEAVSSTAVIFCALRLGLYAMNYVRWGEILCLSDSKPSKYTAGYFLVRAVLSTLPMIAALVTIVIGQPLWVVSIFWIMSYFFFLVDLARSLFDCLNTKNVSVPMHVDYMAHRYGEYTMLCLGEGVLSLVLVTMSGTANSAYFYSSLVPAYLTLACIQAIHFSSQPFYPEGHALYRSRVRGQIWLKLQTVESGVIVAVGVGLKLVIKLGEQLELDEHWQVQWFLCTSLAMLFLVLNVVHIQHNGFEDEFDLPVCARLLKLALYALKAFTSLTFLFIPLAHGGGFGLLMGCWAITTISVVFQRMWDAIDTFVVHASALAMEQDDAMEFQRQTRESEGRTANRVQDLETGASPALKDESDDAAGSLLTTPEGVPGASIDPASALTLRLLPKRLRNTQLEAELRQLHKKFGAEQLQLGLRQAATSSLAAVGKP